MSCKLEPVIWSRDTGQWISCFDRCQLIIVWMSNIKGVHGKPRLSLFWDLAAMLGNSVVVVVVVMRTRPRAIPLAMITMRKSTHGFPLLSCDKYGAPLGGPLGRRSSAIRENGSHVKCFSKTLKWHYVFILKNCYRTNMIDRIQIYYKLFSVCFLYLSFDFLKFSF